LRRLQAGCGRNRAGAVPDDGWLVRSERAVALIVLLECNIARSVPAICG